MTSGYLLGIDVGTYESKGVITTPEGRVVVSAAVGHGLSLPGPGRVEHDADEVWWHDFVALSRKLLRQSGIDPRQILGVGLSALAPCVLPIDREGRPLRPGILYGVDTRSTAEIAELERELGREAIFANSGVHLSAQSAGPKVLWVRRNEPEIWARTATILTTSGYLVFKLTGERVLDHYTAPAYPPLYDVRGACWSADMARAITPLDKLPRLIWPTDVAGTVTPQAAAETGLAAGTPVIAGTADAGAEALSAGLCEIGDMMIMYGSSLVLIQRTAQLVSTESLWSGVYLERGSYALIAGMGTTGSLTRWFRDNFAPAELAAERAGGPNAYAALAAEAARSPVGSKGLVLLPYFAGERTPLNDSEARGLWVGLTLSHTRGDLYRAVLESVGYGIRHNVEVMRAEGGPAARVVAMGGGTRNPLWMQIVCDITGIEQCIPDQDCGACYGDALMAGIGVGLFAGIRDAAQRVTYRQVIRPNAEAHARYQPYFDIYRRLYPDNVRAMHELARLGRLG